MWIRTGVGNYVNSDNVFTFCIQQLKSGDIALTAMKVVGGRVFEVDMAEWNYTGHKKNHKEIRKGGS